MNGKIVAGLLIAVLLVSGASAYYYPDYHERGRCQFYDYGELEWDTDYVCQLINKGDWRERTLRYRAAVKQSYDFDARYNIASGRASGDVFYRTIDTSRDLKQSDWRFKRAYDPRVDNEYVFGEGYYYYEPRYDYRTQTFNWRY